MCAFVFIHNAHTTNPDDLNHPIGRMWFDESQSHEWDPNRLDDSPSVTWCNGLTVEEMEAFTNPTLFYFDDYFCKDSKFILERNRFNTRFEFDGEFFRYARTKLLSYDHYSEGCVEQLQPVCHSDDDMFDEIKSFMQYRPRSDEGCNTKDLALDQIMITEFMNQYPTTTRQFVRLSSHWTGDGYGVHRLASFFLMARGFRVREIKRLYPVISKKLVYFSKGYTFLYVPIIEYKLISLLPPPIELEMYQVERCVLQRIEKQSRPLTQKERLVNACDELTVALTSLVDWCEIRMLRKISVPGNENIIKQATIRFSNWNIFDLFARSNSLDRPPDGIRDWVKVMFKYMS